MSSDQPAYCSCAGNESSRVSHVFCLCQIRVSLNTAAPCLIPRNSTPAISSYVVVYKGSELCQACAEVAGSVGYLTVCCSSSVETDVSAFHTLTAIARSLLQHAICVWAQHFVLQIIMQRLITTILRQHGCIIQLVYELVTCPACCQETKDMMTVAVFPVHLSSSRFIYIGPCIWLTDSRQRNGAGFCCRCCALCTTMCCIYASSGNAQHWREQNQRLK